MKAISLVAVGLTISSLALAQGKAIQGLPVALGDSIEKVQSALGTTMQAEESKSAVQTNTKQLRLKTQGIWVFFDQDGKAYNIRLDAPFAGNIGGVKIGDSKAALTEKLGKPAKVMKGMMPGFRTQEPYLYYIDDRTTVRFDFDRDGEIETAYILK